MWGNLGRFALAAVTVAIILVVLAEIGWWFGTMLVPIGVGIAVAVARRNDPLTALFTGGLVTLGVIALVLVPMIAYAAVSGQLDTRGPDCDGFCTSTSGGVILMTVIAAVIAVPTAIAGGVISMIASFVAGRAS
jgi:hypothetical protein